MEPVTKKAKDDPTALHEAIINAGPYQFDQIIDIFLHNKDAAKIKDANGNYPLYLLCRHRDRLRELKMPNFLLQDVLPYYPDALCQECWEDGFTNPLHMVANHDDYHQLVFVILNKNNSLLNKLNENQETPLQVACLRGSRKCVENILQFPGVNINNINNKGETALLSCAKSVDCRIVLKLLRYPGIDVEVLDNERHSAFWVFLYRVFFLKKQFKNTKRSPIMRVVALFMTFPGVFKWKGTDGENILHDLVQWNNPHILSAVLTCNKGLITECDDYGCTPLHKACGPDTRRKVYISCKNTKQAHTECIKILLTNMDGKTMNKYGRLSLDDASGTALHFACRFECHVAVKALLEHSEINYNLVDECGNTPLFLSIMDRENKLKEAETLAFTRWHEPWDKRSFRLLLNRDEALIFTRNKEGNLLLDMARNRLFQICNAPTDINHVLLSKNQQEELTIAFIRIFNELENFIAKTRWKIFRYSIENV